MTQTPTHAGAPCTATSVHDNWGDVEAALSRLIGLGGVAALQRHMHHRFGADANSSDMHRQAFWSLTASLLGASLTDRLFRPVMTIPAFASNTPSL